MLPHRINDKLSRQHKLKNIVFNVCTLFFLCTILYNNSRAKFNSLVIIKYNFLELYVWGM